MTTLENLMLSKITMKMKKFNLNEIKQLLNFLHLNLEWEDITKLLTECRMRMTIPNVVSIIHHFLKDDERIEETYYRVLLVDAIYHQNTQWWTVSVDKVNKHLLDKDIIRNNIQTILDKLNIKAITYVMMCNELFWILINISEIKKKQTRLKLNNPYFFTIAPGKIFHVFHRPQNVDDRLLKAVIKSVGANKFKPYALSGKHLQSMVNMLKNKTTKETQLNVQKLVNNHKVEDVQEYVQQLFGNKKLVINQFTINIESDMSTLNDTDMDGETSIIKVELKADNIINGVKDMMLSGIFQPPFPDWVTQLPVLSENCVNIKY